MVEKCLYRSVESLEMMQSDALCLAVGHEVGEVSILFVRNLELLCHGLEHVHRLCVITSTEFHKTE